MEQLTWLARRRAVGSQRDRDVHPSAALAAADPDPDERPEQRVSQVAGTLGIYVQLGEETSACITAENDEHHRQRR